MAESRQQQRSTTSHEVGLSPPEVAPSLSTSGRDRPQNVRFRSKDEIHVIERYDDYQIGKPAELRRRSETTTSNIHPSTSPVQRKSRAMMYRFGAMLLLLGAIVPLLRSTSFFSHGAVLPIQQAEAGVIPHEARSNIGPDFSKRADSPTNICFRWAQQCASTSLHSFTA